MNNQPALLGGVDAQQNSITNQINLFLFDLKNEAREHGFKAGDSWTLQIATENELNNLKREHHPVISLRLQTHALLRAYLQVKSQLQQSINNDDRTLTEDDLTKNDKRYLVAYRVKNARS
ncbi:hypothetical protein [Mucilaginibacter sp. BT774]|uniref:hypothetical protein n=1 Tax=Mucilaginibacter sp. BT774 TaxID=3062276 RepID=UPI0026761FA8|nr:hypothetical protein [Mucilaginibacter sp. BT774]MDO3627783.1 hypothetical protein [Mucilaginibacter sp. BT774]